MSTVQARRDESSQLKDDSYPRTAEHTSEGWAKKLEEGLLFDAEYQKWSKEKFPVIDLLDEETRRWMLEGGRRYLDPIDKQTYFKKG